MYKFKFLFGRINEQVKIPIFVMAILWFKIDPFFAIGIFKAPS